MQKFDAIIVGGGIIGAFIFNGFVLKGVKACLVEKGEDVSLGSTKANSGIIHAGYDCFENTLKAKFNVRGNKLYEQVARRLRENIKKTGSLVVGDANSFEKLKSLKERGIKNGVKNLKILKGKKLKRLEPNLNKNIKYGLYAKSAKIISPYNFCISLIEEALINGGTVKLNFNTTKVVRTNTGFEVLNKSETLFCTYLINCCAQNFNQINRFLNEPEPKISFTKGEYMLLDSTEYDLVKRPIFPLPTERGKGIVVGPTIHGNVFLGPTAVDIKKYDTTVSFESLEDIKRQTSNIVDNINYKKAIKFYAGVRVRIGDDFYIKFSEKIPNYLAISGINSPGLAAAPAISEYVLKEFKNRGLQTKNIRLKKRKPYINILKLTKKQLNALIKKDPRYGNIICRCENISEGEIIQVLNGPMKNLTTDGIKRRLRPSMGRCQGSFCYPKIVNLMSSFYKKDFKDIKMRGEQSLVVGDIKEGGLYEKK